MPRKVGRPSIVEKLDMRMVGELAGCGLTEAQMASVLGVSTEAIDKWKQSNPEFLRALKEGKLFYDQKVVKSLHQRALGYSCEETVTYLHKGKVIEHKIMRHYPPDPTSMIFWLKNRDRANWRDKVEVDHGVTDELLDKFKDVPTEELIAKSRAIASRLITFSAN